MYRRIVIATDGSEISRRAAQHGLALAKALGASVTALFTIDTRTVPGAHPIVPESMAPYYFSLIEELRKVGGGAVQEVVDEGRKLGLDVATAVVEGTPAAAVLEEAKRMGADLVVMGTHGRSGFGALLLGSTAQAVVHGSSVPVLLVR